METKKVLSEQTTTGAGEATAEAPLTCTVHPNVETSLRCNKCGRPMCSQCAVLTPVGYRCRECVRGQQKVYFNAQPVDPVIQAVIALALGGLAAGLMGLIGLRLGFIGWLIAFWAGSAAGALIADIAHRAVGKRRGRYSWLIVAGGIGLSGLAAALITGFALTQLIFIATAVSGAVGRLRLGR
jgi:hypothetical protein